MKEQKSMTFGELAGLYFPYLCQRQGRRKLHLWINKCADLRTALRRLDYTDQDRWLTPRMVATIYEYLGEP